MADKPKPTNVIEALARIMAELPAIAKKKHPRQGNDGLTYPYRGIEEITAEAQELFAEYGVVPVPYKTVPLETRWFTTKNGTTWSDEKIEIHWRIYGPGGVDDMVEAQTLGMGRDNSDKGFNKGATQAFKYLLLPMLLVADKNDDADGTTVIDDSTSVVAAPEGSRPIPQDPATAGQNGLSIDDKNKISRTLSIRGIRGPAVTKWLTEAVGREVGLSKLTAEDGPKVFEALAKVPEVEEVPS